MSIYNPSNHVFPMAQPGHPWTILRGCSPCRGAGATAAGGGLWEWQGVARCLNHFKSICTKNKYQVCISRYIKYSFFYKNSDG